MKYLSHTEHISTGGYGMCVEYSCYNYYYFDERKKVNRPASVNEARRLLCKQFSITYNSYEQRLLDGMSYEEAFMI